MREIEVKARVENIEDIKKSLEGRGCIFSQAVEQYDRVFIETSLTYNDVGIGVPVARIRSQGGRHIFTLKKPIGNMLDKQEHETEVADPEELKACLEMMGYKQALQIRKKRLKTKYNGDEICLDEVEELGSFIEMERLTENEDPQEVQEELYGFLEQIGVKREQRVEKGYDILLAEKNKKR